MIDLSNFVESRMTSITACHLSKSLSLQITDSKSREWMFNATGVTDAIVLEMRLQNIIDRIVVWGASSEELEVRRKLFKLVGGCTSDGNEHRYDGLLGSMTQSIMTGKTFLVEFEPVYGALVLAVAEEYSVELKRNV